MNMNEIAQLIDAARALTLAPWIGVPAVAGSLVVALFWLAHRLARFRTRAVRAALDDSTRSHLSPGRLSKAARLSVALDPAPEPYALLEVEFTMGGGGALGALNALFTRSQHLQFSGNLPQAPLAEIVWHVDRTPDQATGRSVSTQLWVNHRLSYAASAYALRGGNTPALEHAFTAMYNRFGPFLQSVTVRHETQPHIRVLLAAGRLNCEDIPPLVTAVRALGRAAQIG